MALIEARGLEKRYGNFQALHAVDFVVSDGAVWGLLGPNGAGKSTTLGILAGTLEPSGGELRFHGRPWAEMEGERRRTIGYVPQDLALYEGMSALENLRFWGRLYGVAGRDLEQRAAEALDLVGLSNRAKDKVSAYSGGMKRRLNLAAAIMHRPRLLLLDEPMVGVDPQSRNLLMGVLQHLREQGMTMIYTSHYMPEVEALCDRVAIIDHGKMLAEDTLEGLLNRSEGGVLIHIADPAAAATAPWAEWLPDVAPQPQPDGLLLRTRHPSSLVPDVVRRVTEAGWQLTGLEIIQPSLESVFLTLTGTALRD